MSIDEIREQIAISLDVRCYDTWGNILDDTNPGHYGLDDVEFQIAINDIWVDIPKKAFTFKDGTLSFSARLGASSERDGVDMSFEKVVSGSGTFEFPRAGGINVLGFKINEKIDLFEEDRPKRHAVIL